MPHNRYFYPGPLCLGDTISLEEKESLHLQKVMRKKQEEAVEIVNGQGTLAEGIIQNLDRHTTEIHIIRQESLATDPLPELHLLQAYIKFQSLEWVIQKGTELGVSHFHFFPGDRSSPVGHHLPLNRWQAIAIGAMKQCGRLFLPTIHCLSALNDYPHKNRPLYFGMPKGEPLLPIGTACAYGLAIGPEGGWSPQEIDTLNQWGKPISLHPHILRAETAALVGIVLLQKASHPPIKSS